MSKDPPRGVQLQFQSGTESTDFGVREYLCMLKFFNYYCWKLFCTFKGIDMFSWSKDTKPPKKQQQNMKNTKGGGVAKHRALPNFKPAIYPCLLFFLFFPFICRFFLSPDIFFNLPATLFFSSLFIPPAVWYNYVLEDHLSKRAEHTRGDAPITSLLFVCSQHGQQSGLQHILVLSVLCLHVFSCVTLCLLYSWWGVCR